MNRDEINAKEKIFQATLGLIKQGADAARLTTRQIAAQARVNPALVNYYYQSKENLLSQVVGMMMDRIISGLMRDQSLEADPASMLRKILIVTTDAAFENQNICRIAITSELKRACKNSCTMIMPFLKELFPAYSQAELDIVALQLMLPFHQMFLDPELYGRLLGTDFYDKEKRKQKINQMIRCVLPKEDRL